MTDREKVIEILEKAKTIIEGWVPMFEQYNTPAGIDYVIALLKEQEAKAGTWQWKIHGKPESGGTLGEAICDQCGKSTFATAVKGDLNYCPNCGAKMCKR